jgi:hypothetical protein
MRHRQHGQEEGQEPQHQIGGITDADPPTHTKGIEDPNVRIDRREEINPFPSHEVRREGNTKAKANIPSQKGLG